MAWLEIDPDSRFYKVCFRFGEQRYKRSLKTRDHSTATAMVGGVAKTLHRLEQGLLELPAGSDLVTFVLSDGKLPQKLKPAPPLTLASLVEKYRQHIPADALEASTLGTLGTHMKHFERLLGRKFGVENLGLLDLQTYVEKRSREKGLRKRNVSPVTIKKVITSFSGVWNWGVLTGLLRGNFPNRGLRYPKVTEKPPFQTWEEIERQMARRPAAARDLWDCLFPTAEETGELLDFAQQNAKYPFLYPMVACAAHTGARRSELIRSRVEDFDFGHSRGAFTGALRDRVGRFELADGGTLFLDEVGEIPLELQAKLLRVLQEGELERVGEERTRRVNVRLVAATNRDLRGEAEAGRFRQDLHYRLSVFPVAVPALRKRKEDIPLLVEHFLETTARKVGRPPPTLTLAAVQQLQQYDWPGNVRELQHVIERAVITSAKGRLTIELPQPPPRLAAAAVEEPGVRAEAQMRQLEADNLRAALRAANGKVSGPGGAAELLGLKPTTLASRLKAFGIGPPPS